MNLVNLMILVHLVFLVNLHSDSLESSDSGAFLVIFYSDDLCDSGESGGPCESGDFW